MVQFYKNITKFMFCFNSLSLTMVIKMTIIYIYIVVKKTISSRDIHEGKSESVDELIRNVQKLMK